MPHVLFVDANEGAFLTIDRAVERGYSVTLIESSTGLLYDPCDPYIASVRSRISTILRAQTTTASTLLVAAVKNVHAASPVDALIAPLEDSVESAAVAAAAVGIRFTDPNAVALARRKDQARAALTRVGLPSAQYALCHRVEEAVAAARRIGLPVIVKPASGTDSLYARTATSLSAVIRAAEQALGAHQEVGAALAEQFARGVVVEELLVGDLVSVEIAASGGELMPFLVNGRSQAQSDPCIEMGAVTPAPLPEPLMHACCDYAVAACRAVGLDLGVFHVELVLTADGPRLVEINPRLMGGVMPRMFERVTGIPAGDIVLDVHLGLLTRPPELRTSGFCTGRKILPVLDSTIPPGATSRIKQMLSTYPNVEFRNYSLRDGGPVRASHAIGRVLAHDEEYGSVTRTADDVVWEFERVLGVDLEKALTDTHAGREVESHGTERTWLSRRRHPTPG